MFPLLRPNYLIQVILPIIIENKITMDVTTMSMASVKVSTVPSMDGSMPPSGESVEKSKVKSIYSTKQLNPFTPNFSSQSLFIYKCHQI